MDRERDPGAPASWRRQTKSSWRAPLRAIATALTSSSSAGNGRFMPWRTGSSAVTRTRGMSARKRFCALFARLPGFKGQAKFSSWLYRITLNLCRDWIRRQRRTPVVSAPEGVDIVELASDQGPMESIEDLVARKSAERDGWRSHAIPAGGAAHRHHPQGISRADVSGDRGPPGLPAEHRQDAPLPRAERVAAAAGCAGHDVDRAKTEKAS